MQLTSASLASQYVMKSQSTRRPSTDSQAQIRRWHIGLIAASLLAIPAIGGATWAAWFISQPKHVPVYGVEILQTYAHDINAFTQGLEFADGELYEGTGQYGRSRLRKVQLETGLVLKEVALPDDVFGEGITVWKDRIIQLTWQERLGFVFDKSTFELKGRFRYTGEGWGLTHNDEHLIMSDGTATLRFLDPETFRPVRLLRVITPDGKPVGQLNELEFINGEIFANIWNTSTIARVSARTGRVVGWIDLSQVRPRQAVGSNAVLNGIAYEQKTRRLFVTGKNWSELFEIRIVPRP